MRSITLAQAHVKFGERCWQLEPRNFGAFEGVFLFPVLFRKKNNFWKYLGCVQSFRRLFCERRAERKLQFEATERKIKYANNSKPFSASSAICGGQSSAELNNVCICFTLWRQKRILSRLHGWFSMLLLQGVVSVASFLLQNNFQKLRSPPKIFQKFIFSLKTLTEGKCLQR